MTFPVILLFNNLTFAKGNVQYCVWYLELYFICSKVYFRRRHHTLILTWIRTQHLTIISIRLNYNSNQLWNGLDHVVLTKVKAKCLKPKVTGLGQLSQTQNWCSESEVSLALFNCFDKKKDSIQIKRICNRVSQKKRRPNFFLQ